MAADSWGVMGMLWGHFGMCARVLRAARSWPAHAAPRTSPVFAGSRSSSMSGAAGGASHGSVVSVVGNVPSCVPGGRDGSREDLQVGVDESGRYVVLVNQLVQCARIVKASAARNALATDGASLAQKLGHGDALQTATWGNHNKQRTCDVKHVPAVLQWAVEGYGGAHVLGQEQRAELAAAVHKAACDLAATRLDAMTGSIGADIAGVDAEVRRLRADLESAKARAEDTITQLQHMHTELSGVREEASRGSTALAAARSERAEEARWRTQLQQDLVDLKAELQVAQQEPAHMHSPGPLLEVEGDASMNETRDQVI